jgi:hypothetical protein
MKTCSEEFRVGRILDLRSEIQNLRLDSPSSAVRASSICYFGFEMQDSSNLEISYLHRPPL